MSANRLHERGGTILICVMACLLVATTIAALAVQVALRRRRELRLEHQMWQTEWLLDAGVMRAAQRISESAGYAGERWLPTSPVARFADAQVEIVVSDLPDGQSSRVEVVASIGQRESNPRTQRTYSFTKKHSQTSDVEKPK